MTALLAALLFALAFALTWAVILLPFVVYDRLRSRQSTRQIADAPPVVGSEVAEVVGQDTARYYAKEFLVSERQR